jgi:DNA-binding MarR family transcriptional regulator
MEKVNEVLIALRRIIRATDLHSKYLAKHTGLTTPQILLLQILRDKGEGSVGSLAKEMSLSQATVTSILDRLEKKELIVRERSSTDRRVVMIRLNDDALVILKDAPLPLQEKFTREFNDLREWEQLMITSSLVRIAQMMDAEHIDVGPVLDGGTLDRRIVQEDKH